jgi:tetratricopeptide (TPR) repeat protein
MRLMPPINSCALITLTGALLALCMTNASGDVDGLCRIHTELDGPDGDIDLYIRAYAGWRLSQLLGDADKKERKSVLKAARQDLDRHLAEYPDDAESLALRGGITGRMITGPISGMRLGSKVSKDLDRALEIAPENPRVALIRGMNFHFTPAAFGAGDDAAFPQLKRARELFASETNDNWPDWGRIDALGWLGRILAGQDRRNEAVAALDEALKLYPGHRWIQQIRSSAVDTD